MVKNSIATLLIVCSAFGYASAQEPVDEKKLMGEWQLIIKIDEAMDEAKRELDEEDNILGELILSSVSGLVESVIENLDINFIFMPGGELEIRVEAMGEEEIEYGRWYINRKGQLFIEGDDDTDNQLNIDDVDYWLMEGNKLYSYDENGRENPEEIVYMLKIE